VFCSRRICFCALGFPRGLHASDDGSAANGFAQDVGALRDFLADTCRDDATVQVPVPKVLPPPPPPPDGIPLNADALDESASMKAKRIALQRKGAAAMIAAEEYARRFESGDVVVSLDYECLALVLSVWWNLISLFRVKC